MPSKNRASFRGREVCDRCGQEWFQDELKVNPKGRKICRNCWDDNEGED